MENSDQPSHPHYQWESSLSITRLKVTDVDNYYSRKNQCFYRFLFLIITRRQLQNMNFHSF